MFFGIFGDPKPFDGGYLPAQDGHSVFYTQYGNPRGIPVLRFHGGPGGKSKPSQAALFDLRRHRVILFDQRGCGKSLPAGETHHNTTDDLLCDAERLLAHVGVDDVILYGGSWGATLALLFAQRHPHRIRKLILNQTFLARQRDIEWIADGTGMFYPDIMHTLRAAVPAGKVLRRHYAELAASAVETDRLLSARLYGHYEFMIGAVDPRFPVTEPTPEHLNAYGIYMHYDAADYGVGDDRILANIARIETIPTLILHNRLDMLCPVEQAWLVHTAMKQSRLVIVPDHGHGSDLLTKTAKKEIAAFLD